MARFSAASRQKLSWPEAVNQEENPEEDRQFTCRHRLGMSQPVDAHARSRGPAAVVKVTGAASKRVSAARYPGEELVLCLRRQRAVGDAGVEHGHALLLLGGERQPGTIAPIRLSAAVGSARKARRRLSRDSPVVAADPNCRASAGLLPGPRVPRGVRLIHTGRREVGSPAHLGSRR